MSVIFAGESTTTKQSTGPTSAALARLVALTGHGPELWVGPELEGETGRRVRLERAASVLLSIRPRQKALLAAALYREVLAEPKADPASIVLDDEDEDLVEDQAAEAPALPRVIVSKIARPSLERTVAQVIDHTMVGDHAVATVELKPTGTPEEVTHAVRLYRARRPIVDGVRLAPVFELLREDGFFDEDTARARHADEVDGLYVDAALRGTKEMLRATQVLAGVRAA